MSQSDTEQRSPHYYIEVDNETDVQLAACVYDLGTVDEPCVFMGTYQEARAWCIEHGDPEAAE